MSLTLSGWDCGNGKWSKVQLTSCRKSLEVGIKNQGTRTPEKRLWKYHLTSGQTLPPLKRKKWPRRHKWKGNSYRARNTCSVLSQTSWAKQDIAAPPTISLCITQGYSQDSCRDHVGWWFLNKIFGDLGVSFHFSTLYFIPIKPTWNWEKEKIKLTYTWNFCWIPVCQCICILKF